MKVCYACLNVACCENTSCPASISSQWSLDYRYKVHIKVNAIETLPALTVQKPFINQLWRGMQDLLYCALEPGLHPPPSLSVKRDKPTLKSFYCIVNTCIFYVKFIVLYIDVGMSRKLGTGKCDNSTRNKNYMKESKNKNKKPQRI